MQAVPFVCLAIVATYVTVRLGRVPARERRAVALSLAGLAATAWLAEDTVVRAYGFYAYSRHLGPLVDRVPVLVALIWSVVIDSASILAARLAGDSARPARHALFAGGIVLADASLIEPVAVRAGLWWWTEPGLFAVPPIGILGWALFTAACVWVRGLAPSAPGPTPAAWLRSFLLPPALTHIALVALWWAAFRWISAPIGAWSGALVVWPVALVLVGVSVRRGLRRRVPRADMLVRVPGALFFYALLALFGRDDPALLVYCGAFVGPYLSLVDFANARAPFVASSKGRGHRG